MFPNSRNILFTGQPSFNHYGDNIYTSEQRTESLDEGIRLLLPRVVAGAMHNSGERCDAPTCHEETRIAVQEDILGWADELVVNESELVTWLFGPAGAGKSAIAQTIAEKLHDRGQLTASFFFSRAGGSEGRGSEVNLVATLAHQLSQSVPATQPHIAAAVRKNPLLFDLALQAQVNALIVAPLIAISGPSSRFERPRIIVVDGLDECRKEKDAQKRVVDALIRGLRRIPYHDHKLFITSRPEHNIVSIFKAYEGNVLRRMELDNRWDPDDDIRTFLLFGFADIRRSHFYFQFHPADKTWPSPEDVDTLVRRSSGQFIYASVVLKYIKSDENYSPVSRLETILSLDNSEDQPYAELDALYHYIFSQIQGVESVLAILSLDWLLVSGLIYPQFRPPPDTLLFHVLGMDRGLIEFRLRPLSSLLVWSDDGIHYKHASLPDFLLGETRSGDFYINSLAIAVAMVSQSLKSLKDGTALKDFRSGNFLLRIPDYYAQVLSLNQKSNIWTLLSNFNVVETVLCNQDIEFDNFNWVLDTVSAYLNWIVAESERYNNASDHLSQPVAQILTWFVDQLELMNANYFDSPTIDIWPFFVAERSTLTTDQLSMELPLVLEVLEYPHPRGTRVGAPRLHQMMILCNLIPHMSWLDRSDLLGHNAMTTERHEIALKHAAYYLFQLPVHRLLETLTNPILFQFRSSRENALGLIDNALPPFLVHSPQTTDLFFLMALLYPVVGSLGSRHFVSTYIMKAVETFPFLTDPTSKDYISASTEAKRALVDARIKSHLHKVAESRQLTWLFEEKLPYRRLLETFAEIDSRVSESCDRIEEV